MESTFNSNGNGGQSGGGTGLSVEGNSQVTVTNSQLSGNMNSNLVAFNQAQVSAQGNTFSNSLKGDGAIFSGQTTANLTGNTFASNGTAFGATSGFNGVEFFSDFTGSATISGNTFSNNTASGLFISSSSTSQAMQITGNTFDGNFVGLNMDASVSPIDAVILGNTFTRGPGVQLSRSDRRREQRHGDHRRRRARPRTPSRITPIRARSCSSTSATARPSAAPT